MDEEISEKQRQLEYEGWLYFNRHGEEAWTTYFGTNSLEGDDHSVESTNNNTQEEMPVITGDAKCHSFATAEGLSDE